MGRHFISDLGLRILHDDEDAHARASITVTPEIHDTHGYVHAGVVAAMVDSFGAGLASYRSQPNWLATTDLQLSLTNAPADGLLYADAHVVRSGRTTAAVECALSTDHGTAGIATLTFAVLPLRDGSQPQITRGLVWVDPTNDDRFTSPIATALDIDHAGDDITRAPNSSYTRNTFTGMQGGVVATLVDLAAARAGGGAVVDLDISYLSQLRGEIGVARTTVLATEADRATIAVEVSDPSSDRGPTAVATCVVIR